MSDLGDFTDFDGDDAAADDEAAQSAETADDGDGAVDASEDTDPTTQSADDDFEDMDATPAGTDTGLGVLSAANGLRIARTRRNGLRAYVTAGTARVRLGKYLVVPYPDDELLFCRIVGLEYAQEFQADDATEIHARRAMREPRIDERDFKFIAELEPIAVLFSDDGDLKRRMVDRVPKPQATVGEATDATQIKTGLKIPEAGVFLGHLSVGGEKVRTAAGRRLSTTG